MKSVRNEVTNMRYCKHFFYVNANLCGLKDISIFSATLQVGFFI